VWWLMIWRLAYAHQPSLPVDSSVIGYCKMHYNFIMSPRVVYIANSLEVDNPGLKKAHLFVFRYAESLPAVT
jgi:hypothetical protein